MSDRNTIIVSAFPGKGKTYMFKNQSKYKIKDSDSSQFSWITGLTVDGEKVRNPNFVDDYISHIKSVVSSGEYDIIFISSHSDIRKALENEQLKYFLIYGYYMEKEAYLDLYAKRGNSQKFIDSMSKNYYSYIESMDKETFPIKIKLQADEFISEELLDKLVDYKSVLARSTKEYLLNNEIDPYRNPYEINWTYLCQFSTRIHPKILERYAGHIDFDTLFMYADVPVRIARMALNKNNITYRSNCDYALKYQRYSKIYRNEIREVRSIINSSKS